MSDRPKLFISFSGRDQHQVRRLMSDLLLQNVEEIWDYSDAGREIPAAQPINSYLTKKIDDCDYFIAVISPHSIDEYIGRFTRFEVEYAIRCGKHNDGKLLPVLLNYPPQEWVTIYPQLGKIKGIDVTAEKQNEFEEAIRQICGWLQIPYLNIPLNDPRVFFAKYFLSEIEKIKLKNSVFIDLLKLMNKCAVTILDEILNNCSDEELMKKWNEALDIVITFLNYANTYVPEIQFYYPLILKGVFQLYTNKLNDAEQTFSEAVNRRNLYDESLSAYGFAGLAHIYYLRGQFDEAASAFKKASELMPNDKDIEFNRTISLLQLGNIDQNIIFSHPDFTNLSQKDQIKIISTKGFYHFCRGEYQTAVEVFQYLLLKELDEAATLYYFLALEQLEKDYEAIQILAFSADRLQTPKLYHYLADKFMRMGYLSDALAIFENILCEPEYRTRRFVIDYARTLKGLNYKKKMREICQMVFDSKNFKGQQLTDEDIYYRGYANYLLGEHKLARFDYESSNFSAKYYSEIELDDLETSSWFSRLINFKK